MRAPGDKRSIVCSRDQRSRGAGVALITCLTISLQPQVMALPCEVAALLHALNVTLRGGCRYSFHLKMIMIKACFLPLQRVVMWQNYRKLSMTALMGDCLDIFSTA